LDEITGAIIDSAIKLHQSLGPGLLEGVYESLLARDLQRRGLRVERQKVLCFELKSVEALHPVHKKQLRPIFGLQKKPLSY
jgi:hypothetical protein